MTQPLDDDSSWFKTQSTSFPVDWPFSYPLFPLKMVSHSSKHVQMSFFKMFSPVSVPPSNLPKSLTASGPPAVEAVWSWKNALNYMQETPERHIKTSCTMLSCKATSHNGFQSKKNNLVFNFFGILSFDRPHVFKTFSCYFMFSSSYWSKSSDISEVWHRCTGAPPLTHVLRWSLASQCGASTGQLRSWKTLRLSVKCNMLHCRHTLLLYNSVFFEFLIPFLSHRPASHRLDLRMGQKDSWVKASIVFWRVPHFWNPSYWNSEGLWCQYRFSYHFCYKISISITYIVYRFVQYRQ